MLVVAVAVCARITTSAAMAGASFAMGTIEHDWGRQPQRCFEECLEDV
jgi:hypothetical protein